MKIRKLRSCEGLPSWLLLSMLLFFTADAAFFGRGLAAGWDAWLQMLGGQGWSRRAVVIGVILACASTAALGFAWIANVVRKCLDDKLHV